MEIGVVELSQRCDHPVGTHAITLEKSRGVDRDGIGFLRNRASGAMHVKTFALHIHMT
jgi:hypothetical protein